MSQAKIILLFFTFFLLIPYAQSQTADEIIQKHIEAIGGYEKIKAIRTLTYEGTNKSNKLETSFKKYVIQDSASCTDGIVNGRPSKGMVSKNDGWICVPGASRDSFHSKSKYEIKEEQFALDIHGPFIDYSEKGNKIKYLRVEKINNVDCFKIKLTRRDKSVFIYYFDNDTYIIKRIEWIWPSGNQPVLTYDYTYKAFDKGYIFVAKLLRLEDGVITTYNNYVINPEIDQSIFLPCK